MFEIFCKRTTAKFSLFITRLNRAVWSSSEKQMKTMREKWNTQISTNACLMDEKILSTFESLHFPASRHVTCHSNFSRVSLWCWRFFSYFPKCTISLTSANDNPLSFHYGRLSTIQFPSTTRAWISIKAQLVTHTSRPATVVFSDWEEVGRWRVQLWQRRRWWRWHRTRRLFLVYN